MDRIRAGLTGLAAVFLVTAAASLLFVPNEAERLAADQQQPGEPLAQLGVAPGSDKNGSDKNGSDKNGSDQNAGENGGSADAFAEPAGPAQGAGPSSSLFSDRSDPGPALPAPSGPSPAEAGPQPQRDMPVAI